MDRQKNKRSRGILVGLPSNVWLQLVLCTASCPLQNRPYNTERGEENVSVPLCPLSLTEILG